MKKRGFTKDAQLRGAKAGGQARAKVLSKKRRREIAQQAALVRWKGAEK